MFFMHRGGVKWAGALNRLRRAKISSVAKGIRFVSTNKTLAQPTARRHLSETATIATPHRWTDNLVGDPMAHVLTNGKTCDSWWTGPQPIHGECAGIKADGTITSLPLLQLDNVTRESAQAYFDNTWALTEVLFAGLAKEEAFFCPPPHGLRHPLIFYYGHVACLYINKLRVAGVLTAPVNAYFEQVLETGVDEMSWDDMSKNDMIWPSVHDVKAYRKQVYDIVSDLIATHPSLSNPAGNVIGQDDPLWALAMGFEHERIHFETSSVLIRELALESVRAVDQWKIHSSATYSGTFQAPEPNTHYPENKFLDVPGRNVEIGKPRDFPSFSWDNAYGSNTVDVPDFSATKYLISNGEFYQFVADGGYQNEELWCKDGWGWRTHRNAKAPYWWVNSGPQGLNEFKLRTTFEEIDMQWEWPVDVNYHEAKAFSNWQSKKQNKSYRLVTEAEHHCIRQDRNSVDVTSDPVMVHSGDDMPYNLNFKYASESPVDSHAPSASGHHDSRGNVWEWTEEWFTPLEGFEIHNHYTDFSTPCFDDRHKLILGGAFASTGDEASCFARFHFRPHFLQQSGFRLIDSAAPVSSLCKSNNNNDSDAENFYNSEAARAQYLLLHYGGSEEAFANARHENEPSAALNYMGRCADSLWKAYDTHADAVDGDAKTRALDLGCAVGGSTLQLTKHFDEVIGVDFSSQFIDLAREVQYNPSKVMYYPTMESDAKYGDPACVQLDDALNVSRASFRTGDACDLNVPALGGAFDAVLMANLICRLPDPTKCLTDLSQANGCGVVRKGGIAMIITPFSWLEEYTPREKWLWDEDSEFGDSFEAMCEVLKPNFELIDTRPMPLLIREHRRKWQYIVPDASIFKRVC